MGVLSHHHNTRIEHRIEIFVFGQNSGARSDAFEVFNRCPIDIHMYKRSMKLVVPIPLHANTYKYNSVVVDRRRISHKLNNHSAVLIYDHVPTCHRIKLQRKKNDKLYYANTVSCHCPPMDGGCWTMDEFAIWYMNRIH